MTSHFKKNALNLLHYGARWYDPAVGRFTKVDPLAEKMVPWNPYNYTFNNPIIYTDPDGRNPILGFLIGLGTELALQKLTGQPVDFGKALISGGAGALSGGLSTIKNVGVVGKLILGASFDASESVTKQIFDNKPVNGMQVISDVVMSGVAGQAKVVDNANMKVLENTADRTKRIAAGDPTSTNRALRATGAKIELDVSKGSNQVAGSVAGDAAQSVSDGIRSNADKNPMMIKSYEMARDNTQVVKIP